MAHDTAPHSTTRSIGVIIANTGSPASPAPDDVEAYLGAYLMDPRIRQLPFFLWHLLVFKLILPKRKFTSSRRYQFVWTEKGSPLVTNQELLCRKVQALFDGDRTGGLPSVSVMSAMSYGEPSIASRLWQLHEKGCDQLILLPLYPQSAYCITQSVVDSFSRALRELGWNVPYQVIDHYFDDPLYICEVARHITEAGFTNASDEHLVLSFHAIPLKDERAGDSYRSQTRATADLVARELGIDPASIHVCYQSVFGPHEKSWASPLAKNVLAGWRDESSRVYFCCPGFAVDCLETIYDIAYEIVPALEGEGSKPVVERTGGSVERGMNSSGRLIWVGCLNATDEHATIVKSAIDGALGRLAHS